MVGTVKIDTKNKIYRQLSGLKASFGIFKTYIPEKLNNNASSK